MGNEQSDGYGAVAKPWLEPAVSAIAPNMSTMLAALQSAITGTNTPLASTNSFSATSMAAMASSQQNKYGPTIINVSGATTISASGSTTFPGTQQKTAPELSDLGQLSKEMSRVLFADSQQQRAVDMRKAPELAQSPYGQAALGMQTQLVMSMYGGLADKVNNWNNQREYKQLNPADRDAFIRERYSNELAGKSGAEAERVMASRRSMLARAPRINEEIGLYDLIKGPDMNFTKGLQTPQMMELARYMVKNSFTGDTNITDPGARIDQLKRTIDGSSASDSAIKAALERNKAAARVKAEYVSSMAEFASAGMSVFGMNNVTDVMDMASALGMGTGPNGSIYGTNSKLLQDRMYSISATAQEYNRDPQQIVEGILQSQAAISASTGASIDPFTGRRNTGGLFELGLRAEQMSQNIVASSGRTDVGALNNVRQTVSGLIAMTGSSYTGQQLNISDYLAQKGDANAKMHNARLREIYKTGNVVAGDAYFNKYIGMGRSAQELESLNQLAVGPDGISASRRVDNAAFMLNVGAQELAQKAGGNLTSMAQSRIDAVSSATGLSLFGVDNYGRQKVDAVKAISSPEVAAAMEAAFTRKGGGLNAALGYIPEGKFEEYDSAVRAAEQQARYSQLGSNKAISANVLMETAQRHNANAVTDEIRTMVKNGNYSGAAAALQKNTGAEWGIISSEAASSSKAVIRAKDEASRLLGLQAEWTSKAKNPAERLKSLENLIKDPSISQELKVAAISSARQAGFSGESFEVLAQSVNSGNTGVLQKGILGEAAKIERQREYLRTANETANTTVFGMSITDLASQGKVEDLTNALGGWAVSKIGNFVGGMDERSQAAALNETDAGRAIAAAKPDQAKMMAAATARDAIEFSDTFRSVMEGEEPISASDLEFLKMAGSESDLLTDAQKEGLGKIIPGQDARSQLEALGLGSVAAAGAAAMNTAAGIEEPGKSALEAASKMAETVAGAVKSAVTGSVLALTGSFSLLDKFGDAIATLVVLDGAQGTMK